jgi:hypothetical protein
LEGAKIHDERDRNRGLRGAVRTLGSAAYSPRAAPSISTKGQPTGTRAQVPSRSCTCAKALTETHPGVRDWLSATRICMQSKLGTPSWPLFLAAALSCDVKLPQTFSQSDSHTASIHLYSTKVLGVRVILSRSDPIDPRSPEAIAAGWRLVAAACQPATQASQPPLARLVIDPGGVHSNASSGFRLWPPGLVYGCREKRVHVALFDCIDTTPIQ